MLFAKRFLFFPPVEADSSLALPDCEELNGVEQFCKNCETELHSSEPDVIQDTACSTIWLYSPTWVDFTNFFNQVQSMFFLNILCFRFI